MTPTFSDSPSNAAPAACRCDDPRFCLLVPKSGSERRAPAMPALLAKFGLAGLERLEVDAALPGEAAAALDAFLCDRTWCGALFHPALQREAMTALIRRACNGERVCFSREAKAAGLTDLALRDSAGGLHAEHLGASILEGALRAMTAEVAQDGSKAALLFTDDANPCCAALARAAMTLADLDVHEVKLRAMPHPPAGSPRQASTGCPAYADAEALCSVGGEQVPKIQGLCGAGPSGLADAAEACLEASRAASAFPDAVVAVNASSAGRFPMPMATPLPLLSHFRALKGVCDVAGEPIRPRLLWDAQQLGLPAYSGFSLRIRWAKEAVEALLGRPMRESIARGIAADAELEARSLILIGMPGCGKTTIGKILAHKLMRRFVDVDELVAKRVGKPKLRIYQEDGEAFFREQETRAILELARERGLVISTGGGSCLRPCNRMLLGLNGSFIWLRRPLSRLSTRDRPIAQARGVAALYEERAPIYASLADRTVDVTSVDDTVRAVLGEARF